MAINDLLILTLSAKWWVKRIDDNHISVIASYKQQLDDIAKQFNLELTVFHPGELIVSGVFKIK